MVVTLTNLLYAIYVHIVDAVHVSHGCDTLMARDSFLDRAIILKQLLRHKQAAVATSEYKGSNLICSTTRM